MVVLKSNPKDGHPGSAPEAAEDAAETINSTFIGSGQGDDSEIRPAPEHTLGSQPDAPDATSTRPVESPAGRLIGRFQIERLLGRGGQGQVWLALDPVLKRHVAIKELPKGTELSEARVAAAVESAHVCRVYDFISTDDNDFIVMEYVDGETLYRAIRRGLPLAEGLRILWQVALGLAAAHDRGVVHRDLKSENVLLTIEGVAKITDFGIAIRDNELAVSEPMFAGTPHSMSPEQTLGVATDTRSDLFSFGILCHEVVVGRSPFLGRDLRETLHRVRALTPSPLHDLDPNVPSSLSRLVERLLSKAPADRKSSAHQLASALAGIVGQSQRTSGVPSSGRGERRQVVLVASDLTLLAGADDPELLLQFRQDYRRAVEHACDELGGSVQLSVGHQYVLCFGYPERHEDSALRAAGAALRIRAWASALGPNAKVGARVAIHAGTAVVLEEGKTLQLEIGSLLSAAQGLRDLAPRSDIAVTEVACEMLQGLASFGDPVSVSVAGRELRFRPFVSLGDASRIGSAAALVGRDEERSLLNRTCERAIAGQGKLVVLQGEPGIGKSCLLHAVRDGLAHRLRWVFVRATPESTNTPLAPMADLVMDLLGIARVTEGQQRRSQAQGKLRSVGLAPEEVLPYFESLLRLPTEHSSLPPHWESPERRRELTLTKITALLQRFAEKEPLAIAIEDVHWADASTLDLLERLTGRIGKLPLVVLVTARPQFAAGGLTGANVTVLQLGALSAEESAQLVRRASGTSQLPSDLVARIVERSEGVPLFLEHVSRSLQQTSTDDRPPASGDVPFSLRDLFAAQIHRAGADRAALEVASVIGREFELPLLRRTAHLSVESSDALLQRLERQGLVELVGHSGEEASWQFRHALIRDAVYDAMLKPRRQALHGEVLEALGGTSPRGEPEQPELLARHAEGAGALERALELWLRAAQRASTRYGLREADEAYERCLGLLSRLSASQERDERELEILAARGAIQQALYGYAAPPVARTYARADELCQALTDVPFTIIRGVWNVHVVRGDKPATLKYADRIERLLAAESLRRLDRSMAHNCLGTFHWFTGEFQRSLQHYEAAAYDPKDHGWMVTTYGGCGGAYARILSPFARAILGKPGAARQESLAVVSLMSGLDDPFSHAMALLYDCMLDHELGADDRAFDTAQRLAACCQEHGFAQLLPLAAITVAAGKVRKHKDLEALKTIGDSLTGLGAVGARTPAAYWLSWLAEALLEVGAAADALGAIEHGFGASATGLDHFYDAELHRWKARALKALGRPEAEVVTELEAAQRVAAERRHTLFELKAAIDLAELAAEAERNQQARGLVSSALSKLDVAPEAPLFRRAQALLDRL